MERQRKYKLFSIIALMFAVVALSVGFAAFQKILNISSSAQVSLPSDDNLKLTLYGAIDLAEIDKKIGFDYSKWSTEKSYAIDKSSSKFHSDYYATIDNENLTINIDNVVFKESTFASNVYYFILKNNSDYGVYVYLSEDSKLSNDSPAGLLWDGVCTAFISDYQTLVDSICNRVSMTMSSRKDSSSWEPLALSTGNYKLEAGEEVMLRVSIIRSPDINDPILSFSTEFEPIEIEFGLTPASYYNTAGVNEEV